MATIIYLYNSSSGYYFANFLQRAIVEKMSNLKESPPDDGMVDGTKDEFKRPSYLQYRRDSMSPEARDREYYNSIDRTEITNAAQKPKINYSVDERYIEIANYKCISSSINKDLQLI